MSWTLGLCLQSVIIKRNQPLAAKGEREYTTIADNQTQVSLLSADLCLSA